MPLILFKGSERREKKQAKNEVFQLVIPSRILPYSKVVREETNSDIPACRQVLKFYG